MTVSAGGSPGRESEIAVLRRRIRWFIGFFIVALILSGVTAFPLETELHLLCAMRGFGPEVPAAGHTGLAHWLLFVREGLVNTYAKYPFIAYGTDWLAFAHIIISLFFIAPWREPGRHLEVLRVGMAACVMVLLLAFICGPIRGIPLYWRLIDCSFGVFGIIPLWAVHRWGQQLAQLESGNRATPQS